jgi:hypothetical protein
LIAAARKRNPAWTINDLVTNQDIRVSCVDSKHLNPEEKKWLIDLANDEEHRGFDGMLMSTILSMFNKFFSK